MNAISEVISFFYYALVTFYYNVIINVLLQIIILIYMCFVLQNVTNLKMHFFHSRFSFPK